MDKFYENLIYYYKIYHFILTFLILYLFEWRRWGSKTDIYLFIYYILPILYVVCSHCIPKFYWIYWIEIRIKETDILKSILNYIWIYIFYSVFALVHDNIKQKKIIRIFLNLKHLISPELSRIIFFFSFRLYLNIKYISTLFKKNGYEKTTTTHTIFTK